MEEKKIWEREQSNIWCCCKEQRWFTSYKQNISFRSHNNFYKAMPVNKTNEMILKGLNSKNKMQQKAKKRIFCVCFKDERFSFSQKLSNIFQQHKVVPWCSGYHYSATSFFNGWTQVQIPNRGASYSWRSLTMVPAGNKAKHLSSVNHTTKTNHGRKIWL